MAISAELAHCWGRIKRLEAEITRLKATIQKLKEKQHADRKLDRRV